MDVFQFLESTHTMLWRSPACRLCAVMELEDMRRRYGALMTMSSPEIENYMFQRSTSQIEYMELLARFVVHVRQFSEEKGQGMTGSDGGGAQTVLDPINVSTWRPTGYWQVTMTSISAPMQGQQPSS